MRDRVWGPLFCPEKKTQRARSANCDVPLCMCLLDAVAQSLQPRCARCAMPCEWAHLGSGAAKGVAARGAQACRRAIWTGRARFAMKASRCQPVLDG